MMVNCKKNSDTVLCFFTAGGAEFFDVSFWAQISCLSLVFLGNFLFIYFFPLLSFQSEVKSRRLAGGAARHQRVISPSV